MIPNKFLILVVASILLISISSAATVVVTGGAGEMDKGIDGVGVPIGIPIAYAYIYTWISLGFLFLIAASASQRNGEFWAILLPIFASMFYWWGWLVLPTAQGIGIIIMAGVLAMGVYFKGKQQEKFGLAGPGSPFLNIVFWMIILQASIGFINATHMFDGTGNSAATPVKYQNVDLSVSVPTKAQTGGFFAGVTDTLYLMTQGTIAAFTMMWGVLSGIFNFKALVLSIAPFLTSNDTVGLFLNVITVAIDFIITVAIWMWIFKPPIGEGV